MISLIFFGFVMNFVSRDSFDSWKIVEIFRSKNHVESHFHTNVFVGFLSLELIIITVILN